MLIRQIRITDNLQQYIECIRSLNSKNVSVASNNDIMRFLENRPDNIQTFVGIVDDNIVSTATLILEQKLRYQNMCGHIEDVGVHPDYRGKGYGYDITKFLVDLCKEYNCYKVKLNCSDALVSFYSMLGFSVDNNGMVLNLTP